MKKFLALLLTIILCLGTLASCIAAPNPTPQETEKPAATLAEAVAYLHSTYKDANTRTANDYDVIAKVVIGTTTFNVTWTVDVDSITVKESTKAGFWTIDLPDKVEEEIAYKLTATVTDANGNSESKTYDRVVPVVDNSAVVTAPVEGTAYKFFLHHINFETPLFATTELESGKFIVGTADPTKAADFYVEAVKDGYKIYTEIEGVKNYLNAHLVPLLCQ